MMNTNQFDKDIKLLDVLNTHFEKKLNQARIKFICLFINALCKIQTVTFSKLAVVFDTQVNSTRLCEKYSDLLPIFH